MVRKLSSAVVIFLLASPGWAGIPAFVSARPVWPKGEERTVNASVRFVATFDVGEGQKAFLRVTGASLYRIRLNGVFAGYGPARGPKGWFRVDEWPLEVKAGPNELELEMAGYYCESYYIPEQPSFLQAEVVTTDGYVLAATGEGGFAAFKTDRVRKSPRYSCQRTFAEVYRLNDAAKPTLELVEQPAVRLLERIVPYPAFALNPHLKIVSKADIVPNSEKAVEPLGFITFKSRAALSRTAFAEEELEVNSWRDGAYADFRNRRVCADAFPQSLAHGQSLMLDAGLNDTGFFGATVDVRAPGRLILTFDEILTEGEVDPRRLTCCNVVEWIFEAPGCYQVETIEPYTWRYANLSALSGEMTVSAPFVRTFKNGSVGRATFRSSDPALDRVFAAAKETFAQNAVDVFTDCPSRERAGWLCDSFFIGRVSRALTGSAEQERLFLQNYQLPAAFDCLPREMVPMCYPADHKLGLFIPNWAMWLVLEVEEYLARSGDRVTVDALRPRLENIVEFLKEYRNADGLLQGLPSWIFIEWSAANMLVRDVNYPSNMVFAEVLDAMDRLYGRPGDAADAAKMRETIRRQSWTGKWFCDNSVVQPDGSLKLSGHCTETCQYYAFFFKTATPETHPELWRTLVVDFGPKRLAADKTALKSHPEVWPSNAFIGNYLRLECLSRQGRSKEILEEAKGFFDYMAQKTGTLWENISTTASCNHGFASHAAITLYRDILGIRAVDYAKKTVTVAAPEGLPLDWCEGEMPLSQGEMMKMAWRKDAQGKTVLLAEVPSGWRKIEVGAR